MPGLRGGLHRAAAGPAGQNAAVDVEQSRVADLVNSPKARWLLAWLAARPGAVGQDYADPFDAADTSPRLRRLHALHADPVALFVAAHSRIGEWRRNATGLAAADELVPCSGYERVAAALVSSEAARWWWQPLRRDSQSWVCVQSDVRSAVRIPFTTSYSHHWDATAPAIERPTASAVSCWTSTRLPELPAAALLADPVWPRELRPAPEHVRAWAVPVRDDARVFEIHGPADWVALVDRYPSHRANLCQAPHLERHWPAGELIWTPDWRAIAQDFDAVHLAPSGWLTAMSRILEVPGRGLTACEGWATESTVWFRPCFHPFHRLEHGPLAFGYGRPETGSGIDLTTPRQQPVSRWRRWWSRLAFPHAPE